MSTVLGDQLEFVAKQIGEAASIIANLERERDYWKGVAVRELTRANLDDRSYAERTEAQQILAQEGHA